MPQIKLTIENDDGSSKSFSFPLSGDLSNLNGIDESVEQFKRAALPEVERFLLTQSQKHAVAQEKKTLADP
jgi:hypothetical protein